MLLISYTTYVTESVTNFIHIYVCHGVSVLMLLRCNDGWYSYILQHNLTYFYTNIHYNVLLHLFAKYVHVSTTW